MSKLGACALTELVTLPVLCLLLAPFSGEPQIGTVDVVGHHPRSLNVTALRAGGLIVLLNTTTDVIIVRVTKICTGEAAEFVVEPPLLLVLTTFFDVIPCRALDGVVRHPRRLDVITYGTR